MPCCAPMSSLSHPRLVERNGFIFLCVHLGNQVVARESCSGCNRGERRVSDLRGKLLLARCGRYNAENRMETTEQNELQESAVHVRRVLDQIGRASCRAR